MHTGEVGTEGYQPSAALCEQPANQQTCRFSFGQHGYLLWFRREDYTKKTPACFRAGKVIAFLKMQSITKNLLDGSHEN